MLSGQKLCDDSNAKLSKMKTMEKLFSSMLVPPRGVELEIFPWLLHLGHPLRKEIQVCFELVNMLLYRWYQNCVCIRTRLRSQAHFGLNMVSYI